MRDFRQRFSISAQSQVDCSESLSQCLTKTRSDDLTVGMENEMPIRLNVYTA